MNVLLLLSALLGVLTNVGAGTTRAPVAAQQVAALGQSARAVVVAPRVNAGPSQPFDVAGARRASAPVRALSFERVALYASRRRE